MRGYLSPIGVGAGDIVVDDRTEIYRDTKAERNAALVAEKGGRKITLGVSDVTVSRKKDGVSPVVLLPKENFIEVHNNNNSNCVVVRTSSAKKEVDKGFVETVQTDAELCLGYNAEFRLTVETVAEVTKIGSVEGDFVKGDKQVDETKIDDSVINRSDIGGDGGSGASVDDSVVNRSNISGGNRDGVEGDEIDETDTKNYCEVHDITYRGRVCPKCK